MKLKIGTFNQKILEFCGLIFKSYISYDTQVMLIILSCILFIKTIEKV